MNYYFKFIKFYLNFLSAINPTYGGKVAINLFQKVSIKKIKPKEEAFYQKAKSFTLKNNQNNFKYYELGNTQGDVIFLIHGWNSNAGSLSSFTFSLAQKNYRVISLDLPAHAHSQGTHTNLFDCRNALINLIKHIKPNKPFSIIGHSFGAAVSVYALAELNIPVNKIVLLSANNIMREVFKDYQKMIGFNDKIYYQITTKCIKKIINEDLDNLILTDKIKLIKYKKLLVIHDKYDKVLPFKSALEIKDAIPSTKLIPFEKIGHYRMLWNDDVVKETVQFIEK